MKKILVCCLLLFCILLVACDSPKKCWDNAIEKLNNKAYVEAETILNSLIEKYPTSEFAEKAKEKTAEIYWNRATDKFNNKDYEESEKILNDIIEKYSTSEFAEKAKEKIAEINLTKNKIKAQSVVDAIKSNKVKIMNGTTTMLQVVIDAIGEPVKSFDDNSHNILLYGEEAKEVSKDNLTIVPFIVKVPILGAKTIKSMSSTFENGKKINKGIGKVICAELNKIEQETSAEFSNAMYRLSRGYGYYNDADAYQMGANIANKMAAKMEKVISCEHIFNIQFERLQIYSFDKKLV
ncbi:tetratricopeptide repeat protein [Candidatus Ruminimicrobiellum ovillum]|uniref:tetratricopeptide repeat protein n=1 Tax=Candidatus Ruminimicrobiellum ovillum TaxID=1947927 RepID=UPI00355A1F92